MVIIHFVKLWAVGMIVTRLAVEACGCSLRHQTHLFNCYHIYGPNLVIIAVETCRLVYPIPVQFFDEKQTGEQCNTRKCNKSQAT